MPRKPTKKAAKTTKRRAKTAPPQSVVVHHRFIRARFDPAQTTEDNRNHWANADNLSPTAALSFDVRRTLRERARYEVANNSFAKGIGLTIANDTIGTGPTLQMLDPVSRETKKIVETLFWEWTQEIRLADKLRLMRFARYDSGECFAQFVTNRGLDSPIQLDVQIIEADQITDPTIFSLNAIDTNWDGIDYDDYGNPLSYRKLRVHPGANGIYMLPTEYDDIPAQNIFHYFRADRPGQLRGIPDVTPALTLLPEHRRFRDATIAAAETAADFAGVLETDAPGDEEGATGTESGTSDGAEVPKAWDLAEITKRMFNVMPSGFKLKQLAAEHPATTYEMFDSAIKREIARCLCVPFHIASLDPRDANMSSAYVVGQMYAHERKVDRSCLIYFLDKLFRMWLAEARLIRGFLPELPDRVAVQWFWPSLGHHADPQKVANATMTDLQTGRANLPMVHAQDGLDWEEQMDLAAKSFGVSLSEYQKLLRDKLFGPDQGVGGGPKPQPGDQSGDNQDGANNANDTTSANGNGYGHLDRRLSGR
jgi:capsid protein